MAVAEEVPVCASAAAVAEEAYQVARQAAERAAGQAQQQHQAHREANPHLVAEYQAMVHEDKWRTRHAERAIGRLRDLAGGHTERPDRQGGLVATTATI